MISQHGPHLAVNHEIVADTLLKTGNNSRFVYKKQRFKYSFDLRFYLCTLASDEAKPPKLNLEA